MIKVSLILPSLNVVAYIRECLESAVEQTLQEMEFICVDAGSSDGTLEIIKEFAAKDQRVRLVNSKIKSYGYQMNLGMRLAQGKYIGILETDDYVPLNMYEELYKIAEDKQVDFLKANFYRFTMKENKVRRVYNKLDPTDTYYGRIINPANEQRIFRMTMNTWSGIYRRSFLEANEIRHNETPGAAYQDNGFFFQTFCCAKRVYFVDKAYYMNRRDNVNSSVFNPKMAPRMIDEYEYIYNILKKKSNLLEKFKGPYALKKFHSLQFAFNNTPKEAKQDFCYTFAVEMERLVKKGEYDKGIFTKVEWGWLKILLKSPVKFCGKKNSGFLTPACRFLNRICHSNGKKLWKKLDQMCYKNYQIYSWICFEGFVSTWKRRKWQKEKVDYVTKEASMHV